MTNGERDMVFAGLAALCAFAADMYTLKELDFRPDDKMRKELEKQADAFMGLRDMYDASMSTARRE